MLARDLIERGNMSIAVRAGWREEGSMTHDPSSIRSVRTAQASTRHRPPATARHTRCARLAAPGPPGGMGDKWEEEQTGRQGHGVCLALDIEVECVYAQAAP
jgi:hypothetical protein